MDQTHASGGIRCFGTLKTDKRQRDTCKQIIASQKIDHTIVVVSTALAFPKPVSAIEML
jgi:hypothetical protein